MGECLYYQKRRRGSTDVQSDVYSHVASICGEAAIHKTCACPISKSNPVVIMSTSPFVAQVISVSFPPDHHSVSISLKQIEGQSVFAKRKQFETVVEKFVIIHTATEEGGN